MHVRLGATKDGIVKGIDLYTLSNTGAYGEHGPTTVGLSGHKSIPLYGKAEAFRFVSDVVLHQPHVIGCVPRVRRNPGSVCGGIRRE